MGGVFQGDVVLLLVVAAVLLVYGKVYGAVKF